MSGHMLDDRHTNAIRRCSVLIRSFLKLSISSDRRTLCLERTAAHLNACPAFGAPSGDNSLSSRREIIGGLI